MAPPSNAELASTWFGSTQPRDGFELFWSRAPLVLLPIVGVIVSCTFVRPMFSLFLGGFVVLFLVAVMTAELLQHSRRAIPDGLAGSSTSLQLGRKRE
jgi:hypothetical protein